MTTIQRWEQPFNFPPGFWKRQLPTKYLAIGAQGDVRALNQLLTDHPEFLNKRGSHNRTLLWEATRRGKLAAVQWLVEHGAEIDATGAYNGESYVQLTPYCAAIYYNRQDIADYLRSQGAHLDIWRAAFVGNQTLVADLLAQQPDLLHADDPHDPIYFVPLLAFAIVGEQVELVDFLLKCGAVVAPYSAQLLYLAAQSSRMDLIELLIAYGAEIPALDSGTFLRVSDMNIFRYLLDHGASITRLGKNGFPPLNFIVRGDKGEHPEKVRILLEYGAQVNAIGPKGRTPLHNAAAAGYIEVVSILLQHGANPALKDNDGETALSLARSAGKTRVVDLLKRTM